MDNVVKKKQQTHTRYIIEYDHKINWPHQKRDWEYSGSISGTVLRLSTKRGVVMDTTLNCIWLYLTNPSARAGYDTMSIFKWSLTGLNSEFSFSLTSCLTKAGEPNLSYYLSIAAGKINGFIPFSRVLVLCEMQSVSSRIWTRIVVFNSYDDNHYTTGIWLFTSSRDLGKIAYPFIVIILRPDMTWEYLLSFHRWDK